MHYTHEFTRTEIVTYVIQRKKKGMVSYMIYDITIKNAKNEFIVVIL